MRQHLLIDDVPGRISKKFVAIDGDGNLRYEAQGDFGAEVPTWRISENGREIINIVMSQTILGPTWLVGGILGDFKVRRNFFSPFRRYYFAGGALDGGSIKRNFFDRKLVLRFRREIVSVISHKIFSSNERHDAELFGQPEIFAMVAVVIAYLDRTGFQESTDGKFDDES